MHALESWLGQFFILLYWNSLFVWSVGRSYGTDAVLRSRISQVLTSICTYLGRSYGTDAVLRSRISQVLTSICTYLMHVTVGRLEMCSLHLELGAVGSV